MSISSDQNRKGYSGNGSSATFNYPYEFHNDSDLAVLIYNSSRSTVTVAQALTTNYNLSGTKDLQGRYLNGANVVFNSSPAAGDEISIFGSTAVNSVYALGFNENISRPDLVKALDHLVLINQRLNNQVTRAVRLGDSHPYAFDPRLPERITAGAPLLVNSSGTALTLGFVVGSSTFAGVFPMNQGGTGASLIPAIGQLLYADTTSSMALMGPGGIDQVLLGQGVGAPVFGGVNLASNSSVLGILPVLHGGTAHSSFVSTAMVYASNASTLSFIAIGGGDVPFVGNQGGAPSFQALNLISGSSTVGLMPVVKGGTAHSSFVAASMVYASSTNILSFIANGGTGQPLVGNNGGAPSYQALDLASNSSVSGILTTSRGGTGNSGYVQYGVAYFETDSKMAHVPSAANGRVLTCHGSSAPTFDAIPAVAATAPTAVSTNYVALSSDDTIIVDGSGAALTITLMDATSNSGKKIAVKKIDATIANPVLIIGSGGQTIDGTSILLYAQYDLIQSISDGTKWHSIAQPKLGGSEVYVDQGSGHGSANTKIRNFGFIRKNIGTGIVYNSSAVSGCSFVIKEPGAFSVVYADTTLGSGAYFGISVNGTGLSSSIVTTSYANGFRAIVLSEANKYQSCQWAGRLNVNDIVRAHTDGSLDSGSSLVHFAIVRTGD